MEEETLEKTLSRIQTLITAIATLRGEPAHAVLQRLRAQDSPHQSTPKQPKKDLRGEFVKLIQKSDKKIVDVYHGIRSIGWDDVAESLVKAAKQYKEDKDKRDKQEKDKRDKQEKDKREKDKRDKQNKDKQDKQDQLARIPNVSFEDDAPKHGYFRLTLLIPELEVKKGLFGPSKASNGKIEVQFTTTSISVRVEVLGRDGNTVTYEFKKKLPEEIIPDSCNHKVKKEAVVLNVCKQNLYSWLQYIEYLLQQEDEDD